MAVMPLAVLFVIGLWCQGTVSFTVSDIFASNMVLQREPDQARIFGGCQIGELIRVSVDGNSEGTSLCRNKQWVVELDPHPAGSGHTISIISEFSQLTLTNVAFGDVWLCSGQSNMQMTINLCCMEPKNEDCDEDFLESKSFPDLRVFTVQLNASLTPLDSLASAAPYKWGVSGPEVLDGPEWSYFSATCYYFGRELYTSLGGKVPIGLVSSSYGGTVIEAWSSPDALAECDPFPPVSLSKRKPNLLDTLGMPEGWVEKYLMRKDVNPNTDSVLWNAMIHPILQMRFKGATWYQGESNQLEPTAYGCRFPAMISDWRAKFNSTLPFHFVQLAGCQYDYAVIREDQMKALDLPNVGYATAVDLGDPFSQTGNIHPRRKREVGRRLGIAVLHDVYSSTDPYWTGPVMENVDFRLDPDHEASILIDITFSNADDLHSHGTGGCRSCCKTSPFFVETVKGELIRLPFSIQDNVVTALASIDTEILSVNYNYETWPECAVYNGQGGPDDGQGVAALPFNFRAPTSSWNLVVRQTYPYLFQPGELSLNENRPGAPNYAVMEQLQNFMFQNKFEFRLRWPSNSSVNIWSQTSNPTVSAVVTGYQPIQISHTDNGWGGLRKSSSMHTLIDGSSTLGQYFYSIGLYDNWNGGIPSWGPAAKQVELYVQLDDNEDWILVFRQTFPYTFEVNQLSINPGDSGNDMFSILDQLESYRRNDGSFRFKIYWPETFNWWRQSTNPVSDSHVLGYTPVLIDHTTEYWGGLSADQINAAMVGSQSNNGFWYYAVAAYNYYGEGYPGWRNLFSVEQIELFARVS